MNREPLHQLGVAIEHLRSGGWDEAHAIAQGDGSALGSWLHGVVHLVEGDRGNARYWLDRAGRALPEPFELEGELRALERVLRETTGN